MTPGEVGERFIRQVVGKHVKYLKSIWHLPKKGNEINLAVLLDDTEQGFDMNVLGELKMRTSEFTKSLMKKGIDFIAHFHLLTDYWEQVRHGNPVLIMEIKESVPIYDKAGFFVPMKRLIEMGRIPGTKESLRAIISSAPLRFHAIRSRHYIDISSMLFECVVDAAQSLLMLKGVSPPVPKKIADKLRIHVPELHRKYVEDAKSVIEFWKRIEHGELKSSSISGKEIDRMIRKAFEFVEEAERLMEEI